MKDFPVFTTEYGVASLILKEIPYRQESYIRIQDSREPDMLLEECISFCRACGAERIYATGDPVLERYPLHTSILEMRGELNIGEDEIPSMFPVTETTASRWREIYNRKMLCVDNASTMEARDERKLVESGGAYFIHDSGVPIGIGWLEENRILALASLRPGAGELVCKAMQSLIPQQQLTLEVASTNEKAISLYERMGFLKTAERSRWYRVF